MYNSIVEAVFVHASETPDQLAIADEKASYTYGKLASVISAIADKIGTRLHAVVVECTQDARYVMLDLACELAGAIFIPIDKNCVPERVRSLYEEAKADLLIANTIYEGFPRHRTVDELFQDILDMEYQVRYGNISFPHESNVAEILFSTGTTGAPKGIVLSHKANLAVAENISNGVAMEKDTVELIPLPMSHSHGLRTAYANLYNGSAMVIVDGVMNVARFFQMIDSYRVNALDISPTLAKLLLRIGRKGLMEIAGRIRYIEIGTAVLEDDTKQQLKEIFKQSRLYNFYGSTEAGRSCVLNFNEFDETGCIGYPSRNAAFYIVDERRIPMASSRDNPGLIAVSGSMMMECYLNDEKLTKQTVVDGIIYTSDLGYVDEEGRIYVIGRVDDIINYKGIKIAPEEIEHVANIHPNVKDSACVPKTDPICYQVPKLYISVVDETAYDTKEFMEYLKEHLELSRIPTEVVVLSEIPHAENGKLLRRKLRDE